MKVASLAIVTFSYLVIIAIACYFMLNGSWSAHFIAHNENTEYSAVFNSNPIWEKPSPPSLSDFEKLISSEHEITLPKGDITVFHDYNQWTSFMFYNFQFSALLFSILFLACYRSRICRTHLLFYAPITLFTIAQFVFTSYSKYNLIETSVTTKLLILLSGLLPAFLFRNFSITSKCTRS